MSNVLLTFFWTLSTYLLSFKISMSEKKGNQYSVPISFAIGISALPQYSVFGFFWRRLRLLLIVTYPLLHFFITGYLFIVLFTEYRLLITEYWLPITDYRLLTSPAEAKAKAGYWILITEYLLTHGFLQNEEDLSIIDCIILPMDSHLCNNRFLVVVSIYWLSSDTSSQCCVSNCSASASVSFEMKCISYLLLPQASAIWAPTDREDLLIWSVSENRSSLGNFLLSIYISFETSLESLYTSRSRKLLT